MRILEHTLANLNKFPKTTVETPEKLSQLIDKYNDMIIDGVEMPCVRPKDKRCGSFGTTWRNLETKA